MSFWSKPWSSVVSHNVASVSFHVFLSNDIFCYRFCHIFIHQWFLICILILIDVLSQNPPILLLRLCLIFICFLCVSYSEVREVRIPLVVAFHSRSVNNTLFFYYLNTSFISLFLACQHFNSFWSINFDEFLLVLGRHTLHCEKIAPVSIFQFFQNSFFRISTIKTIH